MSERPKAFLSYSHVDKEFAVGLADDLFKAGIDLWIDKYEILPGESLIQKVFSEGLSEAEFFLVLLSEASIHSKWVQEELSAAMIKRIEGVTRVVPVLKETSEIPLQLRTLKWVDLSSNYEGGKRELIKALHGVSEKPPIGGLPDYVAMKHSVGGLSEEATRLGLIMLSTEEDDTGFEQRFWSRDLHALTPELTAEEFNDAIDELQSLGLVKAHQVIGNTPYYFADVVATYALYLHFKDEGLDYDPMNDIKAVAAAVAAKGSVEGQDMST